MTNKINGIDVSECPLFDKNTGCYHTFNGECVKDSCAVYKWLLEYKRLQEENKELKKKKDEYYLINLDYETKISYLIQALEEIKEIAKYNQFYNPKYFMLRGNIGQIQNIKMTEIYEKCNEVLNDN